MHNPEFDPSTVPLIFDANDEIGQVSNLLDIFINSGSPEARELIEWDVSKGDDKLKNKLRSFQLNTMEALVEMVQKIKNEKLGMKNSR